MPEEQKKPEFKYIVRIANTDLDGNRPLAHGLTKIKGVGIRIGEAIADIAKLPRFKKIGELTDEEVERIRSIVENIPQHVPVWMINRMRDSYSGMNLHNVGTDVELTVREDINLMKKIRSYKGIRHEQGQRVRGQRTRAHGRTGLTVGVLRKVAMEARKKAAAEGKKAATEGKKAVAEEKKGTE